jgi:hypothetical protein
MIYRYNNIYNNNNNISPLRPGYDPSSYYYFLIYSIICSPAVPFCWSYIMAVVWVVVRDRTYLECSGARAVGRDVVVVGISDTSSQSARTLLSTYSRPIKMGRLLEGALHTLGRSYPGDDIDHGVDGWSSMLLTLALALNMVPALVLALAYLTRR